MHRLLLDLLALLFGVLDACMKTNLREPLVVTVPTTTTTTTTCTNVYVCESGWHLYDTDKCAIVSYLQAVNGAGAGPLVTSIYGRVSLGHNLDRTSRGLSRQNRRSYFRPISRRMVVRTPLTTA